MKKFLFAALLFFASSLSVEAQDNISGKQKAVQKTLADLFQALADQDLDKLKDNCTTDVLIIENGEVWNLDTLLKKASQPRAADFKRINTIEFIDIKVSGKIAWATYNNQAAITRNGQTSLVKWLETAILVKEAGHWKVKTLHSTLLKRS
ncbi:MAG TPA: nuclear transport factor 2 family protein [Puia sp.]|nr:nuclear transport factor 2 family protein [Puia sp.]